MTDNHTLIGKSLKYFNEAYAPFVYKAFVKIYQDSAQEVYSNFNSNLTLFY